MRCLFKPVLLISWFYQCRHRCPGASCKDVCFWACAKWQLWTMITFQELKFKESTYVLKILLNYQRNKINKLHSFFFPLLVEFLFRQLGTLISSFSSFNSAAAQIQMRAFGLSERRPDLPKLFWHTLHIKSRCFFKNKFLHLQRITLKGGLVMQMSKTTRAQ